MCDAIQAPGRELQPPGGGARVAVMPSWFVLPQWGCSSCQSAGCDPGSTAQQVGGRFVRRGSRTAALDSSFCTSQPPQLAAARQQAVAGGMPSSLQTGAPLHMGGRVLATAHRCRMPHTRALHPTPLARSFHSRDQRHGQQPQAQPPPQLWCTGRAGWRLSRAGRCGAGGGLEKRDRCVRFQLLAWLSQNSVGGRKSTR